MLVQAYVRVCLGSHEPMLRNADSSDGMADTTVNVQQRKKDGGALAENLFPPEQEPRPPAALPPVGPLQGAHPHGTRSKAQDLALPAHIEPLFDILRGGCDGEPRQRAARDESREDREQIDELWIREVRGRPYP